MNMFLYKKILAVKPGVRNLPDVWGIFYFPFFSGDKFSAGIGEKMPHMINLEDKNGI